MVLKFGIIEAAIALEVGKIYTDTISYMGNYFNTSTAIIMCEVEDLTSYNGKGTMKEGVEVFIIPVDATEEKFLSNYIFSSVIEYTNSLVLSPAPSLVKKSSIEGIVSVEYSILVAVFINAIFIWLINASIDFIHRNQWSLYNPQQFSENLFNCMEQFPTYLLPIIQKPIPVVPHHASSRYLFAFWLISLMFIWCHVVSYFKAQSSYIGYLRVDTLSDILLYRDTKAKLLYRSTEDTIIERESKYSQTLREISSYLSSYDCYFTDYVDFLDPDIYENISKREIFLITNGLMYELASCIAMRDFHPGEISLYLSRDKFFFKPYSYLLSRNLSETQLEQINLRIMEIFEANTFSYIQYRCKYTVYSKNIWQQPDDVYTSFSIRDMWFPMCFGSNMVAISLLVFILEKL